MMFSYHSIGIIIGTNLVIYSVLHIPLDYITITQNQSFKTQELKEEPPHWANTKVMLLTILPSLYLWIIFVVIPFTAFIRFHLFYFLRILQIEPGNTVIQIVGIILICVATTTACWGRISRGKRAISWGIPFKLEVQGMYRFIRHPLYASYCYYFVGFCLVFQSFLIIPLLLGILGYYETSKYEEEILIRHFGDDYLQYQQRVGRFFPRFLGFLEKN